MNNLLEFQARGSPHVHGTLWLDWEEMGEEDSNINTDALIKAFKIIRKDKMLGDEEKKSLTKFTDKFISCSKHDPLTADIVNEVNVHHHTKACRKYGTNCRFDFPKFPTIHTIISTPARVLYQDETEREVQIKECKKFLDKVKVVLNDEKKMDKVNRIDSKQFDEIQIFKKSMYRLSLLIGKSKNIVKLESTYLKGLDFLLSWRKEYQEVSILEAKEIFQQGQAKLKLNDNSEYIISKKRILAMLKEATAGDIIDEDYLLNRYEYMLSISKRGYGIHYKRRTDEIFVNSYNPHWIKSWNANMDFQITLDFFSIITYITNYYTKVMVYILAIMIFHK